MVLANLCPHKVAIKKTDGTIKSIPPTGLVAREFKHRIKVNEIDGIPIYKIETFIKDLPAPKDGVVYIVSTRVGIYATAMGRTDVVVPGFSVRNRVTGDIEFVTGLDII